MNSRPITSEIIVAFFNCSRKAHLLLQDTIPTNQNDYVNFIEQQVILNRSQQDVIQGTPTILTSDTFEQVINQQNVITQATIIQDDLEAYCDMLIKYKRIKGSYVLEPTVLIGTNKVQKHQIVNLAFSGYVLGKIQGNPPLQGRLINPSGDHFVIELQTHYKKIHLLVSNLRNWLSIATSEADIVSLNEHCLYCSFQTFCRETAEKRNDITLIDRVTPKLARQYRGKGIFTIHQLAYSYRPRKRRRKSKKISFLYKPELHAFAIQNQKIYVHGSQTILRRPTELFIDIEGIPDRDEYYLVGLILAQEDSVNTFSFWSDSPEQEETIFRNVVEKLSEYSEAPIYHYGSYDSRFFDKMQSRYHIEIEAIKKRLININSMIHGRVYFPVASNRLKDIAGFLGFKWTADNASGIQSLVWRHLWEATREDRYREQLITYNREDCFAVKRVLDELDRVVQEAHQSDDIDFTHQSKKYSSELGTKIHADLDSIVKSAHFGYEKSKIELRKRKSTDEPKKFGGKPGHQGYTRVTPKANRRRQIAPRAECPKCEDSPLQITSKIISVTIIDIEFSHNGCKKIATEYRSSYGYCRKCTKYFSPVELSGPGRSQMLGHGLRVWVIYHRVILRLSYQIIVQSLEDLFDETISTATIVNIIKEFAKYYTETKEVIIRHILDSAFVHVDETRINIRGTDYYAWVFTNGSHVFFEMTETRETEIVKKILKDYQGILITDFYGGYDAVECVQQKCLVHLIRDMNEDLWKSPFDKEFEGFVSMFRDLITKILEAIDEHGSRKEELSRFKQDIDNFYTNVVKESYTSETVYKYQKRFLRYKQSLFTFTEYDSIPWNNNTAERAIRHLAVQRKISGSFYESATQDYLVLLSIAQTCRFQEKSFLDFLLSKDKNLENFKKRQQIKRTIAIKPSKEGK